MVIKILKPFSDPPTINTTISLPNIPGTLVSGAGRQNLSVIPGSNVQLFCPVTGIPPARIFWQIDGGRFPVDKNVTNTTIGGIPTAVFTIEQKDNFTEYSCIAQNIAGVATSTVNVRTLSKPTCICAHTRVIISVFMFYFHSYQQSQLFGTPH